MKKPIMVLVTQPWCGACKNLKKQVRVRVRITVRVRVRIRVRVRVRVKAGARARARMRVLSTWSSPTDFFDSLSQSNQQNERLTKAQK
jgi:hypothetical protein